MTIKIIECLILGLIGGIFGRMGGSGRYSRLYRMLGVPLCCVVLLTLLHGWNWSLILCFGTILGATSTYFKAKGQPAIWWNFLLIGLVESIALLPYVFFQHDYIGFAIRTVVCTALVVAWDLLIGWDVLEESGRYFIIVSTLIFL